MNRITNPKTAARFFRPRMRLDVEEIWVAALNSDKGVIAAQCLFRGTVDQCLVHLRDIFRFACLHNAAALIVAHNHPSGSVRPSIEDIQWTARLKEAADLMMIPVADHVIIGSNKHYSFVEAGKILD